MVLLPKLTIKNYRLFQDFTIERLARVNLIAGRNNVGKSALLEAAYLVGTQNPRDVLLYILTARGERLGNREWMLPPLFYNYQLNQASNIEINSGSRWFRIHVPEREELTHLSERFPPDRLATIVEEDTFLIRLEHSVGNGSFDLLSTDGILRELRQPVLRRPWKSESDQVYLIRGVDTLYRRYDELSAWWDEIALTPRAKTVIEILRIVEPRLEKIDFLRQQSNVNILLKGMNSPILIGSLGDGMHHLLVIAVALASAQNGLLLLDEVETGLHYSVLVDLWRLLFQTARKLDVQILATTHSWDCITAFSHVWNQMEEAEGQYCRLDRVDEQIVTEFYSPGELTIAVERGIEPR